MPQNADTNVPTSLVLVVASHMDIWKTYVISEQRKGFLSHHKSCLTLVVTLKFKIHLLPRCCMDARIDFLVNK